MSYTHLLFDLDGTLFDFDSGENYAFGQVCDFIGISVSDELLSLYKSINQSYWKAYERGEITTSALAVARFRDFLASVNKTEADPVFVSRLYQAKLGEDCTPIKNALSVCRTLIDKGYSISIITNGRSDTQHNRLNKSELLSLISGLFISEEIGFQKPSHKYFDHVLAALNIAPSQTLIIGDSLTSDILGGISYGIDTCWYNPSANDNTLPSQAPTYEIRELNELLSIL